MAAVDAVDGDAEEPGIGGRAQDAVGIVRPPRRGDDGAEAAHGRLAPLAGRGPPGESSLKVEAPWAIGRPASP